MKHIKSKVKDDHDVERIRKSLGLNKTKLAELLSVNVSTVSNWEAGKRNKSNSIKTLLRLLDNYPSQAMTLLKNSKPIKIDPLLIFQKLNTDLSGLADLMGLSWGVVYAWQTGSRNPSQSSMKLMFSIYHYPEEIIPLLKEIKKGRKVK